MGKSTWAEDLALELAKDGPVHYIATFKPVDAEDALVIARHKKARAGRNFAVTEKHQGLEAVVIPPGAVVMLEDLPIFWPMKSSTTGMFRVFCPV